jgi:hypothetical protein
MMDKIYLEREYIGNRKSSNKISSETGISKKSILYYLKKYKIPIRENSDAHIKYNFLTKELLYQEYIKDNKSSNEIAEKYNVSGKTILKYLKKNGIDRRTKAQANTKNDFLTKELLQKEY